MEQLTRYFDLYSESREQPGRVRPYETPTPERERVPQPSTGRPSHHAEPDFSPAPAPSSRGMERTDSPWWLASQYIALYLGVLSKTFIDNVNAGSGDDTLSAARVIIALIVATAIFPGVYKKALDSDDPSFVQLCVVFAAGLGYRTLIDIQA